MEKVTFTEREKYILGALAGRHKKELECEKYRIEAHPTYLEEETIRLEELRMLMIEANQIYRKIEALETVEEEALNDH